MMNQKQMTNLMKEMGKKFQALELVYDGNPQEIQNHIHSRPWEERKAFVKFGMANQMNQQRR